MHIITSDQLPEFVDSLKAHFPRSLMAYHIAKNLVDQKYSWDGTDIIVDQYPEYSVCMTRQSGLQENHVSYPTQEYQAVTIFTTSKTVLTSFLKEPNLLNWTRKIAFLDVDLDLIETVRKQCEKHGTVDGTEERCRAKMFLLPFQAWQKLPAPPPLPDDLHEAPLLMDHVEQIAKEWNVEGRGGDYKATYPLFQELIGKDFPSVGIFNEKDELVSYGMYDMVGSAGKAFTREDYRNRGIFNYINYHLAEKIFEKTGHETLFGNVYTHNTASLKVVRKSKQEQHDWVTHTLFFTPHHRDSVEEKKLPERVIQLRST